MSSEFKREDRYIVLKLSRLAKDEAEYLRDCQAKAMVDCVVVEHDWPEYHLVWAMIEHRMAGKPVPDFNIWRRADELKLHLNAADQRIDELVISEAGLREELARNDLVINDMLESNCDMTTCLTAAEQRNAVYADLLQRVVDSSVLSFEQDAPEKLESLEADICAALKPTLLEHCKKCADEVKDWPDWKRESLKPTESGASE